MSSEFFKKSQIQITGEFFQNFDHNSGWKSRFFVIFQSYDPTLLGDFNQNSGNLMKNLKNLDQNTDEKFILIPILVKNLKMSIEFFKN